MPKSLGSRNLKPRKKEDGPRNTRPRRGTPNTVSSGRTIDEVPLTENHKRIMELINEHPGQKAGFYGRLQGLHPSVGNSWARTTLVSLMRRKLAHRSVSGLWYPGPEHIKD